VTQNPKVISKEVKMIMSLHKIRPTVRPIKLMMDRQAKKLSGKPISTENQSKKSLKISISLK
jgi:hypothetical protein